MLLSYTYFNALIKENQNSMNMLFTGRVYKSVNVKGLKMYFEKKKIELFFPSIMIK